MASQSLLVHKKQDMFFLHLYLALTMIFIHYKGMKNHARLSRSWIAMATTPWLIWVMLYLEIPVGWESLWGGIIISTLHPIIYYLSLLLPFAFSCDFFCLPSNFGGTLILYSIYLFALQAIRINPFVSDKRHRW